MRMRGIISVQGWDLLRKNNKFLLVVFVCIGWCVGLGGDAVASCEPGYYTTCSHDPGNYDNCTDCECVPCDDGYTSNGLGVVYDSACNMPSNSGCYEQPCAGHDFPCPSYFSENMRCKKLDYACPSGCGVYSVCNIQNGEIVYSDFMDGSCHIEGNGAAAECQPNTVSCSVFPIDHFDIGWNCEQSAQSGTAEWKSEPNILAWDTKNCSCLVRNRNMTVAQYGQLVADVHCQNANADFYVEDEYRYSTRSVNGSVSYSIGRKYCSKCHPGYLPFVEPSPNDGIVLRPENAPSGNWGTYKCQNMVEVPNYADGCDIDWTVSMGAVTNSCQKSCPAGMETIENGATSIEDCVPDVNQTYNDSTGTFTLGTERCS